MRAATKISIKFQYYNDFIEVLSKISGFDDYEYYAYLTDLRSNGEAEFLRKLDSGEGFKIINIMDSVRQTFLTEEQRRTIQDIPHAILLPKVNTSTIISRSDSSGITQTSTGKFANGCIAIVDHHFQIDQSPDIIVKELLLVDHQIPPGIFIGNFTGELRKTSQGAAASPDTQEKYTITSTDTFKEGLDNPAIKQLYMSLLFRRTNASIDHYVLFALDFTNEDSPVISLYNSLPYTAEGEDLFHKKCLHQAMMDITRTNPKSLDRAVAVLEVIAENIGAREAIKHGRKALEADHIVKPCYEQPGPNDCQIAVAILIKDLVLTSPPRITTGHNRITGLAENAFMPTSKQKEIVEARLNCLQLSGSRSDRLIDMLNAAVPQQSFNDYKGSLALPTSLQALSTINVALLQQYLKGNTAILSTLDDSHKYALLAATDMMLEHSPHNKLSTVYKYFNRPANIRPDLLFSELIMTYLGGVIISPDLQWGRTLPKPAAPHSAQAFEDIGVIAFELPNLLTYGTPETIWQFIQDFNITTNNIFLSPDLEKLPKLLKLLNELITHKAVALDALKFHKTANSTVVLFEQKIAYLEQQYCNIKLLPFASPFNILESITAINIKNITRDEMMVFIKRFNKTSDDLFTKMSANTQHDVNIKFQPFLGIIQHMKEGLGSNPDIQAFLIKYSRLSQSPLTQSRAASSRSLLSLSPHPTASATDDIITLYHLMGKSQSLKDGLMRLELPFSDSKIKANGQAKISARHIGLDRDGSVQITNEKGKPDVSEAHLAEIRTHVANILDLYGALPSAQSTSCYDYIIDTEMIPGGVKVTKRREDSSSCIAFSALQPIPVELLTRKLQEQSDKSLADRYQQEVGPVSHGK
ncbi:MAG: hypothetical protein HON23_07450 [Rickettsiales bacterium]|nr:hypothetical protein [Rickettsiales bacterium]